MAGASAQLHEDPSALQPATIERHRAIVSLMEELEAVDWYDQRVDACGDDVLREVLRHNRDEEKEHAAMTPGCPPPPARALDAHLRTYLFTEGPITERGPAADAPPGSLGIGGLR